MRVVRISQPSGNMVVSPTSEGGGAQPSGNTVPTRWQILQTSSNLVVTPTSEGGQNQLNLVAIWGPQKARVARFTATSSNLVVSTRLLLVVRSGHPQLSGGQNHSTQYGSVPTSEGGQNQLNLVAIW